MNKNIRTTRSDVTRRSTGLFGRLSAIRQNAKRDGAVTVEFAFMAPLFAVLLIGLWQASAIYNVRNQFLIAAREAARLATIDRADLPPTGNTTNEKIINDIRTFLSANGLPGDSVDILIADVDDKTVPFDLDDPDNDLKKFQVVVECSCLELLPIPPIGLDSDYKIGARVVFRNAYAAVVE